jgi:regulator of replication initiation timing
VKIRNLHVEKLTSSWNIRSISGSISAQIEENNDITIQATTLQGHLREDTVWTSTNEHKTKGKLTVGEGTYKLHLFTEQGRIEVNH